jgi:putative thioredoxin
LLSFRYLTTYPVNYELFWEAIMSHSPFIIDVNTADFNREVIEKSNEIPVLVDFWAVWCQPCQMVAPILEALANEFQGKLLIGKVDIDQNQELATQFGVRSVPTLKLFRHAQQVEEVMGAQPEAVLRQLIEPYLERAVDKLRDQAALLSAQGQYEEAITLLQQAILDDPTYFKSHQDLLHVLGNCGRHQDALAVYEQLPANVQAEPEVEAILPQLQLGAQMQDIPPREQLEQQLAANPDDLDALYQLSSHQMISGEYAAAMDNLLLIMRKDRAYQDEAARKRLLEIFKMLGDDPLVSRYRGKLSLLLY